MGYIKINQDKVNEDIAKQLKKICPFDAFEYQDAYLSINAGCRLCKLCVKKGPSGVCEFIENESTAIDKSQYKGITIFIEQRENTPHPVAWELIGKAKSLSDITNEPVYAIVVGNDVKRIAEVALQYGVDKVFVYQDDLYEHFNVERYTNVIIDFNDRIKPNIMLFGGTSLGRSFAPRVAARLKTGLTADCTSLGIKAEGDLIQIRPAFGGNIMAKIHTPNHRPQLATARYKIFDAPEKTEAHGDIVLMETKAISKASNIHLIKSENKPKVKDISDAEIIIAVGRAFKKKKDLELIQPLAKRLNAEIACTRPLIENGWFNPRKQIGLSGRTVKPKLIINIGISGAIQYIEGMKDSEMIISVNQDIGNKLFSISHYSMVGDIYQVLPALNQIFGVDND
ncbi:MAG TPA: electron transfer flavoprotein subunit alpha/FixB family protein [Candidatus Izemoplasmatales bacterium]|nr:electron transfer flavoprotein subunit alpha/FixB family protein [Candidatus Izemoplasmatales bacterium]